MMWPDAAEISMTLPFSPLGETELLGWAIPSVWLGLSGRNSGEIPERHQKRSQSFSWNSRREHGWDPPSPIIQGI